jgi:hypothetical protein
VLAQIEAEKQKVVDTFDERRQALVEARDAEQQAIVDNQNAAIARYEDAERREQQQADRQAQRSALQSQQQAILHKERLDQFLIEGQAIQNQINALKSQLSANVTSQQQQQVSLSGGGSSLSAFGGSLKAFAKGGTVTEPTIALLGENGPEKVIPLRQSSGLSDGAMGNVVYLTFAPQMNVGDIATASQVEQAMNRAALAAVEAAAKMDTQGLQRMLG